MTGKGWRAFKLVSIILVTAAMGCAFIVSRYDELTFWIMLAGISAIVLVYLYLFSISSKNLRKFVTEIDEELDLIKKDSLYRFPEPAAVIDRAGTIIWLNEAFAAHIGGEDAYGMNISSIMQTDIAELLEKRSVTVKHGTKYYSISAVETDKAPIEIAEAVSEDSGDTELTLLCFRDITELTNITDEHKRSLTRIMLIMIDNVEEMLSNSKDSDKGHITMQIDRLVEEFVEEHGGIVRKTTADRYFAVISNEQLDILCQEGFRSIMDKAHKIMVGEHNSVTLSIGIGKSDVSLRESESFARQALEMTLGRGGDQVAIKDPKDFRFFGGNSPGMGKNTKVKTRIFAQSLQSLIEATDNVIIMGHSWGDLDAVGSAAGLAGAIRAMGSNAYVYANENATLAMPIIKRLRDNLDEETDLFIDESSALAMLESNALLIIVDINNKEKLDSPALYQKASKVVYIDHHRLVVSCIDNAVLSLHEPYASSAAEMVTEVIEYLTLKKNISCYYADALLSGIMLDTKNFVMKTGVRTFEAAAYLKKLGADTVAVKLLFASSMETEIMRSKFITTTEMYRHCAIAVSTEGSPEIRVAASQAADEMLSIVDVDASFVIFALPSGSNISARSYGALNVQIIMEMLGGGGHQTMAAAQLSVPPDAAKKLLIEKIDEFLVTLS